MNAKEIKEFRADFDLTQSDLSEITCSSIRAVQSWEQGQRNITQSAIRLMEYYVQDRKVDEVKSNENEIQTIHHPPYFEAKSDYEIPLYDINAAANLQTIFNNQQQNILDTIKIPNLPKCDGALSIRGDSMYPLLKSGDTVIFRHLSDIVNVIYGEMYLVDFVMDDDDYLVVKYVNKSEKENHIKLVSYNTHHHPKDIPINCIRAMALVKALIRINTIK